MVRAVFRRVLHSSVWEPVCDRLLDFGAIMMLHRIAAVNEGGIPENQSLKISPESLDRFISTYRRKGFAFVSIDELAERLEKKLPLGKAMVISFDDGYRDNFTAGLPVLKAHDAPAVVNLATGLMGGEVIDWWDQLEPMILEKAGHGEKLAIPDGRELPLSTAEERREAFRQARWWIQKFPLGELDAALSRFFGRSEEELRRGVGDLYLRVEELAAYRNEKLLTFASHTHHHFACENLDQAGMRAELELDLARLETAGVRPRHFAYPYGRGIRSADHFGGLFRELGFRTVSTTFPDVVRKGTDPMLLPRLVLSEFETDTQHPYPMIIRKALEG